MKSKQSLSHLWNTVNQTNLCIVGAPRRRSERERAREIIWEDNDWKHIKFVKNMNINIQKAQQIPNEMNSNRPTERHIIIKLPKDKDKEQTLKTAREKWLRISHMQEILSKIMRRFLTRNFEGQKALGWHIQSPKRKYCQPRIL